MLQKIVRLISNIVERFLPGAFSFAVYLTFIVLIAGIFIEHQSPLQMIHFWGDSLWQLLPFSMQMVLILLLGSTLAYSPLIKKGIQNLASIPKTPKQAVILLTLVSTIACWLNWGLGLILGGVLAVELAKKIKDVHYPSLIASAYSGFLVWHAGLSGSIPLKLTERGGGLSLTPSLEKISLNETIFSPSNLGLVLLFLLTLPILNMLMHPSASEVISIGKNDASRGTSREECNYLFHWKSYSENLLMAIFPFIYIVFYFSQGGSMTLNIVNLILFMLVLLFFPSLESLMGAAKESMGKSAGIALQFPLYAGIMGMMKLSGLTSTLSLSFLSIATEGSFYPLTYLSAGVVNFFVPSGGGQWVVQGPIIMPAATQAGASLAKSSIALAWGDAWTNMIQPFWALPLLGISGLSLKDIMPYCILVCLWAGFISLIFFTLFF